MRNTLPLLLRAAVNPGAFIISHALLLTPSASMVRNLLASIDFTSRLALMALAWLKVDAFAKVAVPVTFRSAAVTVPVKVGLARFAFKFNSCREAAPIMAGVMLDRVGFTLAADGCDELRVPA